MRVANRYIKYGRLICLMVFCLTNLGAQTIDFSFYTKDYDGGVVPLTERLDPDKNYLMLFSAFWCQPCVKQIDDVFSQDISVYRELYNLEIILLNDDYFDETNIARNKIREKRWYFNQYMTDNIFGALGVNSIPRDYLILAGESTGERVYASNFLSVLESKYIENGYESVFFDKNIQQVLTSTCEVSAYDYGVTGSEMFNNKEYHNVNGQYYRSGILNKNIYRYNPLTEEEDIVFDYYLGLCDGFTLRDYEGDAIQLTVESRTIVEGEIIIETDQMIVSECGEDIPFIMSSTTGSNAGLVFDIEDHKIVSRLVCHTAEHESVYVDDEIANLCIAVNTDELTVEDDLRLTNNPGDGVFRVIGDINLPIIVRDIYGNINVDAQYGNSIDISILPNGIYSVTVGRESCIYIKR